MAIRNVEVKVSVGRSTKLDGLKNVGRKILHGGTGVSAGAFLYLMAFAESGSLAHASVAYLTFVFPALELVNGIYKAGKYLKNGPQDNSKLKILAQQAGQEGYILRSLAYLKEIKKVRKDIIFVNEVLLDLLKLVLVGQDKRYIKKSLVLEKAPQVASKLSLFCVNPNADTLVFGANAEESLKSVEISDPQKKALLELLKQSHNKNLAYLLQDIPLQPGMMKVLRSAAVSALESCDYSAAKMIAGHIRDYPLLGNIKNHENLYHKKITAEKKLKLIKEVVRALEMLQKKGIIHRDLKPGNILITKQEQVKLTDFGLVKEMFPEKTINVSGQRFDRQRTLRESQMGTPDFMSPEQAENYPKIDFRTDMYSLGIILLYLFFDKLPSESISSSDEAVNRVIHQTAIQKGEDVGTVERLKISVDQFDKIKHLFADPQLEYLEFGPEIKFENIEKCIVPDDLKRSLQHAYLLSKNKDKRVKMYNIAVANLPLPDLSSNKDIPELVKKIIQKAAAKKAEDRYSSYEELTKDLDQALHLVRVQDKLNSGPLFEAYEEYELFENAGGRLTEDQHIASKFFEYGQELLNERRNIEKSYMVLKKALDLTPENDPQRADREVFLAQVAIKKSATGNYDPTVFESALQYGGKELRLPIMLLLVKAAANANPYLPTIADKVIAFQSRFKSSVSDRDLELFEGLFSACNEDAGAALKHFKKALKHDNSLEKNNVFRLVMLALESVHYSKLASMPENQFSNAAWRRIVARPLNSINRAREIAAEEKTTKATIPGLNSPGLKILFAQASKRVGWSSSYPFFKWGSFAFLMGQACEYAAYFGTPWSGKVLLANAMVGVSAGLAGKLVNAGLKRSKKASFNLPLINIGHITDSVVKKAVRQGEILLWIGALKVLAENMVKAQSAQVSGLDQVFGQEEAELQQLLKSSTKLSGYLERIRVELGGDQAKRKVSVAEDWSKLIRELRLKIFQLEHWDK